MHFKYHYVRLSEYFFSFCMRLRFYFNGIGSIATFCFSFVFLKKILCKLLCSTIKGLASNEAENQLADFNFNEHVCLGLDFVVIINSNFTIFNMHHFWHRTISAVQMFNSLIHWSEVRSWDDVNNWNSKLNC